MFLDVKQAIMHNIKPKEAYSLHLLDELSSLEILNLVDAWLTVGIESESLFALYSVDPTDDKEIKKLLITMFEELNIEKPDQYQLSRQVAKLILEKIVGHEVNFIHAVHDISDIEYDLDQSNMNKTGKNYTGENLGLEYFFMWGRELSDCLDGSLLFYFTDLPRDLACEKIKEELVKEAQTWLQNMAQQNIAHQ